MKDTIKDKKGNTLTYDGEVEYKTYEVCIRIRAYTEGDAFEQLEDNDIGFEVIEESIKRCEDE